MHFCIYIKYYFKGRQAYRSRDAKERFYFYQTEKHWENRELLRRWKELSYNPRENSTNLTASVTTTCFPLASDRFQKNDVIQLLFVQFRVLTSSIFFSLSLELHSYTYQCCDACREEFVAIN